MPSAAYSLASVRARPVTAARIEFESSRPSTGCLTADEVMVIRRPHLFFCMRGRVSLAKKTVLIRSWSTAERQSSGFVFLNELDGGPPELVTQISMRPKRASTAVTKVATADKSVASSAGRRVLMTAVDKPLLVPTASQHPVSHFPAKCGPANVPKPTWVCDCLYMLPCLGSPARRWC